MYVYETPKDVSFISLLNKWIKLHHKGSRVFAHHVQNPLVKKVFFHRSFWCKVVCKLWMHPIFFPFQKIKKKFLWTYVHMFSVCAFTSWLPPFTCKNIRIKIQKLFRSKVVILYIIVHGHVYMRTHNRLLYLKSRWSKTKTKFGKSKINANEFQNV